MAVGELGRIAAEMRAARRWACSIAPFSDRLPTLTMAQAYAVGRDLHAALLAEGETAVGRKIGFTNPAMWTALGVRDPIWAHMYASGVAPLDALPFVLKGLVEPRIEPEIVFRLAAVPPRDADLAGIASCIEWVAQGFEIVQSHFPLWRFRAPDTVIDGGLHGALRYGPPLPLGEIATDPVAALAGFTLELYCDGKPVEAGRGANVLGNPLAALAHLVALVADDPQAAPLQPGEIITTGTITAAWPVRAGENWSARLAGIALSAGEIRFT